MELGTRIDRDCALAAGVAGAVAGVVAVLACRHPPSWWLCLDMLIWAYTLVGAACCDAATQRVPISRCFHSRPGRVP